LPKSRRLSGAQGKSVTIWVSEFEAARMVREIMRLGFLLERAATLHIRSGSGRASHFCPSRPTFCRCCKRRSALTTGTTGRKRWREPITSSPAASWQAGSGPPSRRASAPDHERPFTTINADEIIAATCAAIADPRVRDLPVIGGLDQGQ